MNVAVGIVAFLLLLGVLALAVVRPRGLSEATVAVPAAVLLVGIGAAAPSQALAQIEQLGPVVVFLALLLVLGYLCDRGGLFVLAGAVMGRMSRGRPVRLLGRPHVYACTHLANTASLLLPVSNLTNLLAFTASGLSFLRFGAVMAALLPT